jgi:hypothetical protein
MADGTIMDFPKRSVIEWQAVAMVVVFFLWIYSVCSHYVVPAKTWEMTWRRQLLLDKLSTEFHKLFVSTPWIAPIFEFSPLFNYRSCCVNEFFCTRG